MQTSLTADELDIRRDLEKLYELSSQLDFPFSLDDAANYFLPARDIAPAKLRSMISNGNFADIPFYLKGGYLLTTPSQSKTALSERERVSKKKLRSAARFANFLRRAVPFIRTVAVTGSVAYQSANTWDDIDLFIVTERRRLWLSVLVALALVRVEKLLKLSPSHLLAFCLSYVHDERGFAEDAARNKANPLFARELLKAKPVVGTDEYLHILRANNWVGELYSAPYSAAIEALGGIGNAAVRTKERHRRSAVFLDWADGMVYVFLSRYLKLRAYLTNLKLTSRNESFRVFEQRITRNSCVYTSNFYKWLHSLWGEK